MCKVCAQKFKSTLFNVEMCCSRNNKQVRRIYEILRLYYTNRNDDDDFTSYRLNVKKRLNAFFQRDMLMKALSNGEASSEGDSQDKKKKLHLLFEALLEEYSAIVAKLNESEGLPVNGVNSLGEVENC